MDIKKIVEQAEIVYKFRHRSPIRAPGVVIGTAMVSLGLEQLKDVKKLGAVAEARACLSDAVQALTGCTVGNKYLKIYDEIGRYAIVLYDRIDGKGLRVFIDLKKIKEAETPELYKFFHRKRAPEVQYDMEARALSAKKVIKEFLEINHDIFGVENVMIKHLEKEVILPAKVCVICGESFTCSNNDVESCLVCSKKQDYYSVIS